MGDGTTADGGIFRSNGASSFSSGAGYHLNPRNSSYSNLATFRVGDPAGGQLSYDGTSVKAAGFTYRPQRR
jgi:hypothetical protein